MHVDRHESGAEPSQDGVGKALREVKTLVGFMELIGGNSLHICAWLNEPQLVSDLHAVLGPAGFAAAPSASGERDLPRDVVLRLAACFADRPELLLAMLDVALPRCQEPPKELMDQWSALAQEAAPAAPVAIFGPYGGIDLPPLTPPMGHWRRRLRCPTMLSSRRINDAQSSLTLSPEPAKQDCLSEDGDAACSTLTPDRSPVILDRRALLIDRS